MKDAIEAIAAISAQADELKPAVQQIAKAALSFGPEIAAVLDAAQDYMIDRRAADVKRLEEVHGFSRADAIALTLDVQG
ncbi:hypothetical protein LAJ55_14775, partial [Streptococcus pneumoniae]|uniref:hypothetical protein n=1 Tax=Streptococcus pneumoniae TaxID=1313 RepID=UPI001CBBA855